ncbi:MAG: ABC transporter substrate-binding protein [Candidatus Kerfeldbacteria bacterium]|nr:ABC transporter substrate-binding protein [Candidatus Kerfeldbacteria bacterium]
MDTTTPAPRTSAKVTITVAVILIAAVFSVGGIWFIQHIVLKPAARPTTVISVGILKRVSTLDPLIKRFIEVMNERGYQKDLKVHYEERNGFDNKVLLRKYADAFVSADVELILAVGDGPALVAWEATAERHTPTVFFVTGDAVELGLIESYGTSGNHFVGVGSARYQQRQIEILTTLIPTVETVGVLTTANDRTSEGFAQDMGRALLAASMTMEEESITSSEDVGRVFVVFAQNGVDAVFIAPGGVTSNSTDVIAQAAIQHRLPLFGNSQVGAASGVLFTYFVDQSAVASQLADMALAILNGAPPSQLSSQFPEKGFLSFNQSTAEAIGVTIPQQLLEKADVLY